MLLRYQGKPIPIRPDQTVLDAIHAAGEWLSFGCRSGSCQTCLVRATSGKPPAVAQRGLDPALQESAHFLACQAMLESPLSCVRPDAAGLQWRSRIISRRFVTPDILRLRLEIPKGFHYRAGQYISIWRDDEVGRAYSLNSLPGEDRWLQCYIRVIPGGYLSEWLANQVARGYSLQLRGPAGACYYQPVDSDKPLLLVGAGVGMAPLAGVLRDALRNGHRAPISVYHGVRQARDLVFDDFLREIAASSPGVSYHPCVGCDADGVTALEQALFGQQRDFKDQGILLCGSPGIINRLRQRIFLGGAASRDIRADEFSSRPLLSD